MNIAGPALSQTAMRFPALALVLLCACPLARPADPSPSPTATPMEPYTVREKPLGFIGVRRASVSLSLWRAITGRPSIEWLKIDDLDPHSPGVAAGIRTGDRILSINGRAITTYSFGALREFAAGLEPGQKVSLEVGRDGVAGPLHFEITVARKPAP